MPCPFCKNFSENFLVKIKGEIKFTFIVSKSSLSLNFEKSVIFPKPAQLITKSTSQFSTIFSKLFISVKSYFMQTHSREENFSSNSFFRRFNLSSERANKKSFLALFAKFFANSFPIPELAPVIKIFSIIFTSLLFLSLIIITFFRLV